jgi:hypothetical protein
LGKLFVGGHFYTDLNGQDARLRPNLFVAEGLLYVLGVAFAQAAAATAFYLAPFSGDVTPDSTLNASNFAVRMTEFTGYSETTRPAWAGVLGGTPEIDNSASLATCTISVANSTVWGFGLGIGASGAAARFRAALRASAGENVFLAKNRHLFLRVFLRVRFIWAKKKGLHRCKPLIFGGEGGIRTHGTLTRTPDFESGTFDHSATSPKNGACGPREPAILRGEGPADNWFCESRGQVLLQGCTPAIAAGEVVVGGVE